MNILVTGSGGFVGRNLVESLKAIRDGKDTRAQFSPLLPLTVFECGSSTSHEELSRYCSQADFVFHLAGVNRPQNSDEFMKGNCNFLSDVLDLLEFHSNCCPVVLASSIQASLSGRFEGSEYGKSKLEAEHVLRKYAQKTGAHIFIYRFPNLFGKWCRPNYNSVVATFCDAIANDRGYSISDPDVELELLYIDDLIGELISLLMGGGHRCSYEDGVRTSGNDFFYCPGSVPIKLGDLAEMLEGFRRNKDSLEVYGFEEGSLSKKLWSTYQSYIEAEGLIRSLGTHADARGSFTELLRSRDSGQVYVNISKPGITKGNHWHHSKWEKFIVLSGEALIRIRRLGEDRDGRCFPVDEYQVSGDVLQEIEVPPGATHSITNLSSTCDLITLIWANEPFDAENPDTFFEEV